MKIRIVLLSFLLLFFATTSYALNGTRLIGTGTTVRSMGGATVGLPLDSTIVLNNPAGMSVLDGRFDVGLSYLGFEAKHEAHSNAGLILRDRETLESDTPPPIVPFVGMILPINDKLKFGFATSTAGVGVDYERSVYNNVLFLNYAATKYVPAVSYKVNDFLSLGAGLNLHYATLDYELALTTEPAHNDGVAYGYGAVFGAFMNFTDYLSAGIAYETKQIFGDFKYNTTSGQDKLEFNLPQSVSVGFGVKPSKTIRFAFDIVWIDWPQTLGKNKPRYTKNSSGSTAWNADWKEQWVFKLGMEYDLTKELRLRAGYNYGKRPTRSSSPFENIALPAIQEKHYTAGAGYDITKNLALNVGFLYSPKTTFSSSNSAAFIDDSKVTMSEKSFDLGLSYRF